MVGTIESLLIISGYIVSICLFAWVFRAMSDLIRYRRAEKMFFNDFDKQLGGGLVKGVKDVVRIRQTVSEEKMFLLFASQDLAPLLRIYLRRITYSKERNKNKKLRLVKSLLNQLTKEKPFEILPEKEREIALRVQESIKEKEEKPDISLKLLEDLTTSLGERLKAEINRNRRNRWTIVGVTMGIFGIVVTLTVSFLFQ